MLLLDKSLSDKRFQAYKLVCGASTFAETTLCGSDNFVSFQVPDESIIDHSFHNLANAAGDSNGAIILGFNVSFPGFGIGTTYD